MRISGAQNAPKMRILAPPSPSSYSYSSMDYTFNPLFNPKKQEILPWIKPLIQSLIQKKRAKNLD
jgi:hypothetical protein